ncbi:hypothetical protein [Aliarcobacter butzleri]|uniref:hypothetical protein n=1 Tax=Aliarcobacter butzleri TaxID=28197 RepID=UPI00344CE2A5
MKIGKEYKQVASQLLGCTLASYYNWDNQKRPIINLLEKYFTKEDLHEFLETNQISKLETLNHYELSLNIEFNTFYREKLDNDNKPYIIRFFWDFIARYTNELSYIEFYDCKSQINKLLLDYHLFLIELYKKENGADNNSLIIKKYSEFMSVIQNISDDLLYFIITNIKSNFKSHINYLLNNVLFSYAIEILACTTIKYYDNKLPINREVRARVFINNFSSSYNKYTKEFYYQLEEYLNNYEKNEKEIVKILESSNDKFLF